MRERVGDRLPSFTEEERREVKGSVDFLGRYSYGSSMVTNKGGGGSGGGGGGGEGGGGGSRGGGGGYILMMFPRRVVVIRRGLKARVRGCGLLLWELESC